MIATSMHDARESITEQLRAVLSRLAAMEKTFDWPIREWASVYQEKLELERKLISAGDEEQQGEQN